MEMDVLLLGVYVWVVLLLLTLVGHVVGMWRNARKKKKDMGRLKAGSVWRQRPRRLRNDPFVEEAPYLVTVLETKVNSDGRLWVKYLHNSVFEKTNPADEFVRLYFFVEDQDLPIMENAGEVVQNAAQHQNLAGQLLPRDMEGERQPYTSSEMMSLGINNYLKRSGRGETVRIAKQKNGNKNI